MTSLESVLAGGLSIKKAESYYSKIIPAPTDQTNLPQEIPAIEHGTSSLCNSGSTNHPSPETGGGSNPTDISHLGCTIRDPHKYLQNELNSQENDVYIMACEKETEKIQAQIAAAKRSMITNLILGGIFCFFGALAMFIPSHLRPFFASTIFSFFKATMPIFTTIANFGTVQFVLSQYWHSYQNYKLCWC